MNSATVPILGLGCSRPDDVSLLRSTGLSVSSRLDASLQNLKDAVGLQRELENTVIAHLKSSLETYTQLSQCQSQCDRESDEMLNKVAPEISQLRLEMSLMQPEEVGTNAIESVRGWMSVAPKHPFTKSPSIPHLSLTERDFARDAFLARLAEKLPFVAARISGVKLGTSVLGQTALERTQVAQAMVQIQNEARTNYLRAIGRNPLLIFLEQKKPNLPTSARDLAAASKLLANEIAAEISRLQGMPSSPEKAQAFIEYRPLVESTLRRHPEYCTSALQIATAAERSRAKARVGLVVGQVAAGFASAAFCSTILSCGFAAAILSGVDFGIAAHEANVAFREGLGAAVTSQRSRDAEGLMMNADSAARIQGLTLALGAPTVLKSGGDLLRASSSLLRPSVRASETVVAKSVASTKELVGSAPMKHPASNAVFRAVYATLMKDHAGRESEIIEVLIRRYETKGLSPVDIAATIRQRVRQCVQE